MTLDQLDWKNLADDPGITLIDPLTVISRHTMKVGSGGLIRVIIATENAISEPIASYSLILIGTVHGDPRGQARAGKLLNHLEPDLVTVEISPFSLRYRRQHEARWQRQLANALAELPEGAALHLAIRRLAAQVALPFEVRAARDYQPEGRCPLAPPGPGFFVQAAPAPVWAGTPEPG